MMQCETHEPGECDGTGPACCIRDIGMGGDAPGQRDIFCTDCKQRFGKQHLPHCHRQGLVTAMSDYRDKRPL